MKRDREGRRAEEERERGRERVEGTAREGGRVGDDGYPQFSGRGCAPS